MNSSQVMREPAEETIAIRWLILEAAERRGPIDTDSMRRYITRRIGLTMSNASLANMASTLHRAGLLIYRSADSLSYGNHHQITDAGRGALRYFKPKERVY
jgi:hypothetical protein